MSSIFLKYMLAKDAEASHLLTWKSAPSRSMVGKFLIEFHIPGVINFSIQEYFIIMVLNSVRLDSSDTGNSRSFEKVSIRKCRTANPLPLIMMEMYLAISSRILCKSEV